MTEVCVGDLIVAEIFRSIQGESTYSGKPCLFVRLAGCNLKCRYCDAVYARDGESNEHLRLTLDEIVSRCDPGRNKIICITGGEPLLQPGIYALMQRLIERNVSVLLETNGSLDVSQVPREVVKVMDVKCPGSEMEAMNRYENLSLLTVDDQLKFVLTSRGDFDFALRVVDEYNLDSLHGPEILLSAAVPFCLHEKLAEWLLESGKNWRLQVQLHKVIWPGRERGV